MSAGTYYPETFWNQKRLEHDFTIEDLAAYVNTSNQNISFWFTGRTRPPHWAVKKIAELFDMNIAETERHFEEDWNKFKYRAKAEKIQRLDKPKEGSDFWNQKRADLGLSVSDFGSILTPGITRGKAKDILEGSIMPTPRQIEQFAEFFDISKEEAKHQFEVCCEEYNKKKGRPEPQEQNYAEGPEAEKKAATEQLQALVPNTKSALPQNLRTDLMESLYGKVPFNEWLQIANNGVNYESLKNLYGQIDIETYTRLLREIKDRPKYEFDFRQIYGKIDREVFEMLYDNIQDRKERPLNELKHENNDR